MNAKQLVFVKKVIQDLYNHIDIKFSRSVLFKDSFYKNGKVKNKVPILVQNKKLKKEAYGFKKELAFYGLELLPFNLGGRNLCKFANSCIFNCLAYTGKGSMIHQGKFFANKVLTPTLTNRAIRTYLLNNDKEFFLDMVYKEATALNGMLDAMDIELWVRLNVFSDEKFESKEYDYFISKLKLQGVRAYDYTKDQEREELENYLLTYSHSEDMSDTKMKNLLKQGKNVAVIFDKKKKPDIFKGYPVIDGDLNDNRPYDPRGVIIGLSKKQALGENPKTKGVQYVEV